MLIPAAEWERGNIKSANWFNAIVCLLHTCSSYSTRSGCVTTNSSRYGLCNEVLPNHNLKIALLAKVSVSKVSATTPEKVQLLKVIVGLFTRKSANRQWAFSCKQARSA